MEIRREAGALGARVTGIDLASGPTPELVADLRAALLEHLVLCIPGQAAMTPAQHLGFARLWGAVAVHPYVPSIEGHEGVMRIYDPNDLTATWHQDMTHLEAPPAISILVARVLPRVGGDTTWSNQERAYERLSPGLRDCIDGLRAVHQGTWRAAGAGLSNEQVTAVHPVVRTHPETGRKALFVNANYTKHFDGWTAAESAPLLGLLYAEASRLEYSWRHRWTVGDVLIWDNRATQHCVVADTDGTEERTLHRVTIAGDIPV